MKDEVLAADPLSKASIIDKLHAFRNLEPALPGCHGSCNISRANAGGEGAKGAVCARMAIGPNYKISGNNVPLLRKQCMFNPHPANLKIEFQPLLS
ncbi:hypothetical protein BMS3Bbin07_00829 [bacterium BMS3Bbin07]|nr:hypothetical protein BMS3Bbin07_00829 [bacterium BMS3Bbin07]